MNKLTSDELVGRASAEIDHIDVQTSRGLLADDAYVFVDIRERDELDAGRIPNSVHAARGNLEFYLDPQSSMHMPVFSAGKTYIFVCGSGRRAALGTRLAKDFGLKSLCLAGGMRAWHAEDGPLVRE